MSPPHPGTARNHKARGADSGATNISTSPRKPSSSASSSGCTVLEPTLCSKYGGNACANPTSKKASQPDASERRESKTDAKRLSRSDSAREDRGFRPHSDPARPCVPKQAWFPTEGGRSPSTIRQPRTIATTSLLADPRMTLLYRSSTSPASPTACQPATRNRESDGLIEFSVLNLSGIHVTDVGSVHMRDQF